MVESVVLFSRSTGPLFHEDDLMKVGETLKPSENGYGSNPENLEETVLIIFTFCLENFIGPLFGETLKYMFFKLTIHARNI